MTFTLNLKGRLVQYRQPAVMGIINVTPDSFYAASRAGSAAEVAVKAAAMLAQGADIIDLGACSTRPGAAEISEQQELDLLIPALEAVRMAAPKAVVSVDTYRARVAREAADRGADIINDVSGGKMDPDMMDTVAELRVPYVLTHMRGTPADMMDYTNYPGGVVRCVLDELGESLARLNMLGVADVIIDPGFGFSKTVEQNFELMRDLKLLQLLHRPILVGISRKSMITKTLGITADDALEATTALNAMALDRGASLLRVHDPLAARQAVELFRKISTPTE